MMNDLRPTPTTDLVGSSDSADWSELVTLALLGTDRRAASGPDPAAGLLDRAALQAVGRRAGLRPGPATALPPAAPEDGRPSLPDAAERRLAMLLPESGAGSGGGSGSRGSGNLANIDELLPQYLAAACSHGFRAPSALVPPLLDAARSRSELRSDAVELAGPLGRWLAERNPDWRYVLRTPTRLDAAVPDARLWQEGLFAERVTHLTLLRRRDPAAARELLAGSWTTERAEDRLLFLDALQENLGPADEPFLEAALSDRSKNVRATAAELLCTLPGSALGLRMAQRALSAVQLDITAAGARLMVRPPSECDAAMQRDGVAAVSPTGRAERTFWLAEIIAATPLDTWTELLGTPAQALALPVPDGWAQDLRDAWSRAAVRQNDGGWARALLAGTGTPTGDGRSTASTAVGTAAKLLAVLPPDERAAWTTAFLDGQGAAGPGTEQGGTGGRRPEPLGLGDAFQLLVACPAPWPAPLGSAVLRSLARFAENGGYPWSHSGVLGVAERSLAPETADALDALAAGTGSAWAELFARLAATLRLRSTMLAELAG